MSGRLLISDRSGCAEGLADAREQYATLLRARPKQWVLDDALVARSERVNSEALDWCGVYDRQLARWLGQRLTAAERRGVIRLQGVQRDQRRVSMRVQCHRPAARA